MELILSLWVLRFTKSGEFCSKACWNLSAFMQRAAQLSFAFLILSDTAEACKAQVRGIPFGKGRRLAGGEGPTAMSRLESRRRRGVNEKRRREENAGAIPTK